LPSDFYGVTRLVGGRVGCFTAVEHRLAPQHDSHWLHCSPPAFSVGVPAVIADNQGQRAARGLVPHLLADAAFVCWGVTWDEHEREQRQSRGQCEQKYAARRNRRARAPLRSSGRLAPFVIGTAMPACSSTPSCIRSTFFGRYLTIPERPASALTRFRTGALLKERMRPVMDSPAAWTSGEGFAVWLVLVVIAMWALWRWRKRS
jgi:hypothetical protein